MLQVSRFLKIVLATFALVVLVFQFQGCASDSYAAKGAAKGGGTGAVSGAVGGLVSALVFGGDPAEAAARGAVYGGAVGATAGGIAGSEVDRKVSDQQEDALKKLREKIGTDAYDGLSALADCNHAVALRQAEKAKQNSNPNYALAGLWLEVLSYSDQGNEAKARGLFPAVVEKDWNINSKAQAEEKMRSAMNGLMDIREQYKLPRVCN